MSIRHINIISSFIMTLLLAACVQDDGLSLPNGKLRLSLGQISNQTESRATPQELGKPLAEQFKLKVQRKSSQNFAYDGPFTEELEVRIGEYEITATCGEDVIIGRDTPYYVGKASTSISKDQQTSVSIPCKVGNALVSVQFGMNETENARFSRYYSDYGLLVQVGNYSMPITPDNAGTSIYFPAGSSPKFTFYGKLKDDNDRAVSTPLSHPDIPGVFQAADHAKLTLTLPDPESALGVNIGKAEMTTVQLDETIPLSWLPVSTVIPIHQFNGENRLVGTNLTFSNNYPGMEWKAVVTNAQGETVRSVTGTGALFSEYTSSSEWPYLPAGKYKATYYLVKAEGDNKVSSREFMIGSPAITAKATGYTSYDKYLEGDLDAANAADGLTLYEPQISVNIASSLTANTRYGFKMTYTFNDMTETITSNTYNLGQQKLAASTTPYVLYNYVEFAGEVARANKGFQITGIPLIAVPPTTAAGWAATTGGVEFTDTYVRMGKSNWIWGEGDNGNYMAYTNVAIPRNTRIAVDYSIVIHPATVGTTFTCKIGNDEVINHNHNGGAMNSSDYPFAGINTYNASDAATRIECKNSYGAGQTRTDVYKINLTYGQ